jgi:hypothetical protein
LERGSSGSQGRSYPKRADGPYQKQPLDAPVPLTDCSAPEEGQAKTAKLDKLYQEFIEMEEEEKGRKSHVSWGKVPEHTFLQRKL